jgi:hypothetical protein
MALMMMGPQSTQTTQSLFQYQAGSIGESHSFKISVFQFGSRRPSRDCGLPAVSASDGENLSDFCCQIACRKIMWRNRRANQPNGCARAAVRVK